MPKYTNPTGDAAQIHVLLAEIGKDKHREYENGTDVAAAALHLSIRCASCELLESPVRGIGTDYTSGETVSLLLSHRSISPNAVHPSGTGTTALHLAASIGRADVVNLLLEQDEIDDTARDSQGRTCKDVARGKEVHKIIRGVQIFRRAERCFKHFYQTHETCSRHHTVHSYMHTCSRPRMRPLHRSSCVFYHLPEHVF